MNKFYFFAFVFLSSFFISCSGDGDDDTNTPDNPVTSTKKIASNIISGGTEYLHENMNYYYANNKLSYVNRKQVNHNFNLNPWNVINFSYDGAYVIMKYSEITSTNGTATVTVTLNKNGLAISMHVNVSNVEDFYHTFTYNNDGYLVEVNRTEIFHNESSTKKLKFSYVNNNLATVEKIDNGILKIKATHTYGNQENKGIYYPLTYSMDDVLPLEDPFYSILFSQGYLGKVSKHLVQQTTYTENSNTKSVSVSYTLDNEGYVSKVKVTNTNDNSKWYELSLTYND